MASECWVDGRLANLQSNLEAGIVVELDHFAIFHFRSTIALQIAYAPLESLMFTSISSAVTWRDTKVPFESAAKRWF